MIDICHYSYKQAKKPVLFAQEHDSADVFRSYLALGIPSK